MELAAVREDVRAACLRRRVRLVRDTLKEKNPRRTLAFARLPIPRYTRLLRRWTSVRIILSSRRLSSVRRVSIRARAAGCCRLSSWLEYS